MKLPKEIKIGPYTYKVVKKKDIPPPFDDSNTRRIGQITYSKELIEVVEDLSGTLKETNIWHEVMHGIDNLLQMGLSEKNVDDLSNVIVQVLKDNPALVPKPR